MIIHEDRDSFIYCNRTNEIQCNDCTVHLIEIVRISYALSLFVSFLELYEDIICGKISSLFAPLLRNLRGSTHITRDPDDDDDSAVLFLFPAYFSVF